MNNVIVKIYLEVAPSTSKINCGGFYIMRRKMYEPKHITTINDNLRRRMGKENDSANIVVLIMKYSTTKKIVTRRIRALVLLEQ